MRCPPDFRPALSWKTQVAQVKELPPGSRVGYGGTYVTQGVERIAVIPVGYADGFRRSPENWGEVLADLVSRHGAGTRVGVFPCAPLQLPI